MFSSAGTTLCDDAHRLPTVEAKYVAAFLLSCYPSSDLFLLSNVNPPQGCTKASLLVRKTGATRAPWTGCSANQESPPGCTHSGRSRKRFTRVIFLRENKNLTIRKRSGIVGKQRWTSWWCRRLSTAGPKVLVETRIPDASSLSDASSRPDGICSTSLRHTSQLWFNTFNYSQMKSKLSFPRWYVSPLRHLAVLLAAQSWPSR